MYRLFASSLAIATVCYLMVQDSDYQTEHKDSFFVPKYEGEEGLIIVDFVNSTDAGAFDDIEYVLAGTFMWADPELFNERVAIGRVEDIGDAIDYLSKHPFVESVEPWQRFSAEGFGTPNDPLYPKQWHLREMGADYGWSNTNRGKGVVVAVLDTGVTVTQDLKETNVLKPKSFVPNEIEDGNGHGTHVAGTIAQSTNNGIGTAGVAPNATIMPVKVLSDQGFGSQDWIASGIYYAVKNGADVINMSLGGNYSPLVHKAVRHATENDVLVFAACGNSNVSSCGYPGGLEESIGVGATGPDNLRAPYSSYGSGLDLVAPGGNKRIKDGGVWQNSIISGKDDFYELQGTSMATPHAAGAAAILLSTGMAPQQVRRTLLESADGKGWSRQYGHGRLNLKRALITSTFDNDSQRVVARSTLALTILFSWLAGAGFRFGAVSAVTSVVVASGVPFVNLLPINSWLLELLASPILTWPNLLVGGGWSTFPLWLSALIPVFLGVNFSDIDRRITSGLSTGFGAYLFWAATQGVQLWGMNTLLSSSWLLVNAVICFALAMSLAGLESTKVKVNEDAS